MSEQAAYRTERLDHLGIVAGSCQEIELIEVVLALICSHQDGIPTWLAALDGAEYGFYVS